MLTTFPCGSFIDYKKINSNTYVGFGSILLWWSFADWGREQREWTDDTDHALLILLSYLHHDGKELSSRDLAERLRSWVEQGLRCLERFPAGLGETVGAV